MQCYPYTILDNSDIETYNENLSEEDIHIGYLLDRRQTFDMIKNEC